MQKLEIKQKKKNVEILSLNVIYKMVEEIETAMKGRR